MTNCDVEDLQQLRRATSWHRLREDFLRGLGAGRKAVGTYAAEFYVEYSNNNLIIIEDNVMVVSKGAMRTALAAIYMDADSYIYVIGDNIDPQYDVSGRHLLASGGCDLNLSRLPATRSGH